MELERELLAKVQKRLQKELSERERKTIEYWKGELDRIYRKRHEGLASFHLDIKALLQKMENRIKILKKEQQ